ncbi:aspartyl/glutamyl-tRNA amidotransferase subunit A [Candidatus Azambacteria bacterium RBG_16_47_10]|uniref:Glutamyl-tRNA(Gln) amidotransferase subunit A n=1 Tax=Candidatus Azambacteria bacterium RBG_16_47_10 TaxID=1797292 RepID=A0A1F5B0A8_9BACT|nr:MAG: aspartyl/glutamyl-tRNA amidotransferase subunit A [Candidatus Azambacteria bacterium RBG_16_47_10]
MDNKLITLSIKQAHEKLITKEFSARELTKEHIAHIEKTDGNIRAYVSNTFDDALAEADRVDERIRLGDVLSPLAGIPAAIKDNILIRGHRATAGSKMLETYIASYDATVIERLRKQQTVFLGKTNMDEFAMGSSTENSAFFPTKNPVDVSRVPGGSSGGSAAAVASHQAVFALGSDTGGSIRQPASFCGVVGMKPTYGAVSRHGLMAMASSLDQIGPITRSVEDAELVFQALAGKDPFDATSVTARSVPVIKGLRGARIGVPKEYFDVEGMDTGVRASVERALVEMEKAGAKLVAISLPNTKHAISVYYIIMPAEVSSNLARYDGIRYGYSTYKAGGDDVLADVYERSRSEGFGKEVQRRIMLGTYVLSAGYYDAYYKKAQQVRTKIKEDFEKAFENVDIIATPTTPTSAFRFGEKTKDPLSMYLEDIFTIPANLAGLPALSLPCGMTNGLPVGLQLVAPWFAEESIFAVGKEYEHVTRGV